MRTTADCGGKQLGSHTRRQYRRAQGVAVCLFLACTAAFGPSIAWGEGGEVDTRAIRLKCDDVLARAAASGQEELQVALAEALEWFGLGDISVPLLAPLVAEGAASQPVRLAALSCLHSADHEPILPEWEAALKSEAKRSPACRCWVIGKQRDEGSVEYLVRSLSSADEDTVVAAIWALKELGRRDPIERLERPGGVRDAVFAAQQSALHLLEMSDCAWNGGEERFAVLHKIVLDPASSLRQKTEALRGLSGTPPPPWSMWSLFAKQLELFFDLSAAEEPTIRYLAVMALGRLSCDHRLRLLVGMLDDPDPKLQVAAAAGLVAALEGRIAAHRWNLAGPINWDLLRAVASSCSVRIRYDHPQLDLEHLVLAVLEDEDSAVVRWLRGRGADVDRARLVLTTTLRSPEYTQALARQYDEMISKNLESARVMGRDDFVAEVNAQRALPAARKQTTNTVRYNDANRQAIMAIEALGVSDVDEVNRVVLQTYLRVLRADGLDLFPDLELPDPH